MTKSFTLIELIVVLAIIVILAAITLPNYKKGAQQFALDRSAHKLAQDIRRIQQMAMSAAEFPPCKKGTPPNYDPIYKCGYGIYFKQAANLDEYILFADCNDDKSYSPGADEIVEDVKKFEKGVIISSLSSPFTRIVFVPPDPTISILPGSVTIAEITLALENNPSKTKMVKINKAGLITVE